MAVLPLPVLKIFTPTGGQGLKVYDPLEKIVRRVFPDIQPGNISDGDLVIVPAD